MTHAIARLFGPLLRLLIPGRGRHRATGVAPATRHVAASVPQGPRATVPLLRGEDCRLVRPYLAAHEQRQEARQQRARSRELWLAVHGIDIGPRLIHGMQVTA
ncbi:hypothetical protein SSPS47_21355 [Streptomyces sp. S4.7]|uniref:hypothetical protein n=1 Tax=Streptomyces sp. S4.7 TaxID=2705439 RepID=UPI001397F0C4|nr:hypothetical protein [Streptomyces sp. S4.7]QHY97656.1 hypothetical protein SSPS47_21355 [Streptomyces sp. S4.7]